MRAVVVRAQNGNRLFRCRRLRPSPRRVLVTAVLVMQFFIANSLRNLPPCRFSGVSTAPRETMRLNHRFPGDDVILACNAWSRQYRAGMKGTSHPNPTPLNACGHRLAGTAGRMTTGKSLPTTGDRGSSCFGLDLLRIGTSSTAPTRRCADLTGSRAPVGAAVRPRWWWRPASPISAAHGLSSGVAARSTRPGESVAISCGANIR